MVRRRCEWLQFGALSPPHPDPPWHRQVQLEQLEEDEEREWQGASLGAPSRA